LDLKLGNTYDPSDRSNFTTKDKIKRSFDNTVLNKLAENFQKISENIDKLTY